MSSVEGGTKVGESAVIEGVPDPFASPIAVDPAGLPIDAVRPIIDDIDRRVQQLLTVLDTPAES